MKKLPAILALSSVAAAAIFTFNAGAQTGTPGAKPATAKTPEFPPAETITKDFTKVVSTADGKKSFYTLYRRDKDQALLAELPKDFAKQRHYIALTVASGESYAGLQSGERYVYWRRYGKRLALVEPNLEIRSTGDNESKSSVKRLFTDRVLLDIPILSIQPNGGPIIDLDALLVDNASTFFGSSARGLRRNLMQIKTAKAFPENVEIGIEIPTAGGQLRTFHYSISLIAPNKNFKPRRADERVGYFTTAYTDFGKYEEDETKVRYANRWHLEKADPKLKLSPPKEPIVFYIEHTTPIRYRRWVREGILMWNEAFEKVGLIDAVEVRQQDAATDAHMDKDPEDVRYNFVRWLNNGVGTAIGPSRVDPNTGQILDADIILTDGWIRHFWTQYNEILPDLAIEGYSPQTLSWLYKNPRWDPRVRLAAPSRREAILAERATRAMPTLGGHALGKVDHTLIGDQEYDGLISRYATQKNGLCMAANCKTHGLALKHMALAVKKVEAAAAKKEEKKEGEEKPEEPKEQMLDGVPESFIGPLLADLVAHEVGHTLGLRHNFKASSVYRFEEINSKEIKEKKPLAGSVMDYIPVNMNAGGGKIQGDYGMIGVGPYDLWAIEYGYTFDEKALPKILSRCAEPELAFATDEDTWGPDPLARRYDFGKDPLVFAKNQMALVKKNRDLLLKGFVKDGQSWSKARDGYLLTLSIQTRSLSMMSNWVGGTFIYRDRKGDPNGRAPIEVVPVAQQRAALDFVIANAFDEKAFGVTPELLRYMTLDKWWGEPGVSGDPLWPVHDRILNIQASALTSVMNPTTLGLVYDNEFRVPADQDALTLPELLGKLRKSIFPDLKATLKPKEARFSARKPALSSFARNLQKEYIERLIDLIKPDAGFSAAHKPIQDLASIQLGEIKNAIDGVKGSGKLDPYTKAHLGEISKIIEKALNADYVVNLNNNSGGLGGIFILGKEEKDGKGK
jgi:hypothetical protein